MKRHYGPLPTSFSNRVLARRVAAVLCVFLLLGQRLVSRPEEPEDPPEEAKEEGEAPKKVINPAELRLPASGYAAKLKDAVKEEKESGGVRVQLAVIPDAYRYNMALAFEELKRVGVHPSELEAKVRKLHSQYKGDKGKALFLMSFTAAGDAKTYYFLQNKLKEHLVLKGETKMSVTVSSEEPRPKFTSWQVFEQRDNVRKVYKRVLAELKELKFSFTIKRKDGDSTPLTLTVKDLIRVRDNHEEQKNDLRIFESINTGQKQIATPDWKGQIVPEVEFKLYPGKWKLPKAPREFEQIIEWVELH